MVSFKEWFVNKNFGPEHGVAYGLDETTTLNWPDYSGKTQRNILIAFTAAALAVGVCKKMFFDGQPTVSKKQKIDVYTRR